MRRALNDQQEFAVWSAKGTIYPKAQIRTNAVLRSLDFMLWASNSQSVVETFSGGL